MRSAKSAKGARRPCNSLAVFPIASFERLRACEKNLLRSGSRVPAVLGILMYFNIHSGSCAPAERHLPSLATIFSQALRAGASPNGAGQCCSTSDPRLRCQLPAVFSGPELPRPTRIKRFGEMFECAKNEVMRLHGLGARVRGGPLRTWRAHRCDAVRTPLRSQAHCSVDLARWSRAASPLPRLAVASARLAARRRTKSRWRACALGCPALQPAATH